MQRSVVGIRSPRSRPAVRPLALALILALAAGPLAAQGAAQRADSAASDSTVPMLSGTVLDDLPVDRIEDALLLLPGVTTTGGGEITLRGTGGGGAVATYIDGVPMTSGGRRSFRNLLGTNAVAGVSILGGPLSARYGNASSGVVSILTRRPDRAWDGELRYGTDELSGAGSSLGFNRLQGAFGGWLGQRLSIFAAGVLQGQQSAASGFDAMDAPLFVATGSDLTIDVPTEVGNPLSDTTAVDIHRFAVFRGDCEAFAESENDGIADNYGADCRGVRIPGTARSAAQGLARIDYALGDGSRLSFTALAAQDQGRPFDYTNLYNPQALWGARAAQGAYTLSWIQRFGRSGATPIVLESHLSRQTDRITSAPLTAAGERDSRDPFGGALLAPLDFRFGADEFAVDEELVENIRLNQGRRSPYDLNRAYEYSLKTIYGRVNPYGVTGNDPIAGTFNELGGPDGRLLRYEENRTVGAVSATWAPTATQRLRVGGELARYSISNYDHTLTSQRNFDVYIENPTRGALYVEDRIHSGALTVEAGVRYDFYESGASRAFTTDSGNFFPRISSNPGFDPADPTATFHPDERHSVVSPRLRLDYALSSRAGARFGLARLARAPDFADVLRGINTDISATNFGNLWGTDLDFERTQLVELGLRYRIDADLTLDVAGYTRETENAVVGRLVSLWDPLRGNYADVGLLTNDGEERVRGLDIGLEQRLGGATRAALGYSYQNAEATIGRSFAGDIKGPATGSRPHTFTALLAIQPTSAQQGLASNAVFRNLGAFAAFRYASGTPYTACALGSSSEEVLSGESCNGFDIAGELNGMRLPSFKTLDLRLTKGFGIGGKGITAFVDVRNLLNFRNVLRVFTVTNDVSDENDRARFRAIELADMASEAAGNNETYGYDVFRADSTVDLTFGGAADPTAQCGNWSAGGSSAAPNCVYLIRAEERFGNGDHVYTKEEQLNAIDAFYATIRGPQELTGSPRRIRLGLQVGF